MKMKQSPSKAKTSLFHEYTTLAQETSDYLEYYLTTFAGKNQGIATEILK